MEHWSSPNGCHPDCPACAKSATSRRTRMKVVTLTIAVRDGKNVHRISERLFKDVRSMYESSRQIVPLEVTNRPASEDDRDTLKARLQ